MVIQDPVTVAVVAVALGTDAFSVALGFGMAKVAASFRVRFVGIVSILHVLMPLIGLEIGFTAGQILGVWAGRIGALVLVLVAYDMLKKGVRNKSEPPLPRAEKAWKWEKMPPAGASLAAVSALSLSVSMDALTVGFGLGTAEVPIGITVAVMGVTAGIMTAAGFWGGRWLGKTVGRAAQALGGCVLLLIALKMVL